MSAPRLSFVCFETGIGEDDNESLGISIGARYRSMLLGNKLWKLWRWKGLGSCRGRRGGDVSAHGVEPRECVVD